MLRGNRLPLRHFVTNLHEVLCHHLVTCLVGEVADRMPGFPAQGSSEPFEDPPQFALNDKGWVIAAAQAGPSADLRRVAGALKHQVHLQKE